MIKILGFKRVLILAGLAGLNIVLAAAVYMFLLPHSERKMMQLESIKAQVATVQSDINRLQLEFDQIEVSRERFKKLEDQGFFINQDRRQAEQVFENIQKKAEVITALANIGSGSIEENEEAKKAKYGVLKSSIKIHIEALDAADVYRYIYFLERFFPGHITLQTVKMARKNDVNNAVLRNIVRGANPVLVEADLEVIWRTMIPQTEPSGPAPVMP